MTNEERLKKVFISVIDEDNEWDSLTHVQLTIAIEREFNIKFKTAEIIGINSFGDFLFLIKQKVEI
ncbi:MAG: acyl carrier protein [Nitrospirae bacterium]|nr:acyl carrier protein [Nitrospirota bacterium]